MARTYSAEGIIIKRINFGEADRLITFLSRYKGKFTAIAKGVRKVASRRGPNLELLNHVKVYFAVGKNLDVVTEVQTLTTFRKIKDDLFKIGFSFHLTEMVDEFLAEGQGGRQIFNLLLKTLNLLQEEENPEKVKVILHAFDLKFLENVGYKPQLLSCAKCSAKLGSEQNFFSAEFGGIIGQNCRENSLFSTPISQDAIKVLRFLQSKGWQDIKRLLVDASLNSEVESLSRFYIEYLMEKELKSAKFIDQIRN
ncbi:MAG TPA: DNA repair protein RecO [Candidatus Nanoarchaeia archaeon]